jgi:Pro-kumamolisin, activation domain
MMRPCKNRLRDHRQFSELDDRDDGDVANSAFQFHCNERQPEGESMSDKLLSVVRIAATLTSVLAFLPSAHAQFSGNTAARPMITGAVVETNVVRLAGNVRPEANAANDLGRVPDNFPMEHMFIQLQRPPTEEAALQQLIDQLHDPNSPNFHQWLTPEQFGTRFGPAASDVQRITSWLQGQGFRVNLLDLIRVRFDYPRGSAQDHRGLPPMAGPPS